VIVRCLCEVRGHGRREVSLEADRALLAERLEHERLRWEELERVRNELL
jgi:hypothetical protein